MTDEIVPELPAIESMRSLLERLPPWDSYATSLVEHVIAQNLACIGIAGQRANRFTEDGHFVSFSCNYGDDGYGPELPISCHRVPK